MTTEIEKQFFECFGIEKEADGYCKDKSKCPYDNLCCVEGCPHFQFVEEQYPEITTEKLLELICIYFNNNYDIDDFGFVRNVKELKNKVLKWMIYFNPHPNDEFTREDVIKYVRKLFEE